MAKYTVSIMVDGTNINTVRKQMATAFPGQEVKIDKINFNPSRSDRLAEAETHFEDTKTVVEELKDEMENWRDNLPENLQDGSKAEEIQEAIDGLEEIQSNLDSCDFGSVSFPKMM